jgi:SepF-like predicted cell division protein (DUF552 family)
VFSFVKEHDAVAMSVFECGDYRTLTVNNGLLHDNNVMNIDIENLPDDPATLKKILSQVMSRYQYLE